MSPRLPSTEPLDNLCLACGEQYLHTPDKIDTWVCYISIIIYIIYIVFWTTVISAVFPMIV